MGHRPQISVVLPCYNAHEFLPRALSSLRAQTYQDFEIIVVNDGSTDSETIAFLERLPDDIRLVHQQNQGLGAARNRGFAEARGAYVLPLDCDDWIAPEFLADAYDAIRSSPDTHFVFPDMMLEGEGSGLVKKTYNQFGQLFANQLPYCMLISRSAWLAVGGYDTEMPGYQDWDFNIRLSLNGYRGIPIGKPHFHYWVSASGMAASMSRPRHVQLWRYIRSKHGHVYTILGLFRKWWGWRNERLGYPLVIYLVWEMGFRFIPDRVLTSMFRLLRPWLYSRQVAWRDRIDEDIVDSALPIRRIWQLVSIPIIMLTAVFSRLATYLILIVAARILAPAEFGLFAVLTAIGGVVNALVSGGGDMWLNRFTTRRGVAEHRPPRLWTIYIAISVVVSSLAMLIAAVASALIPELHKYDDTLLIAIGAFCIAGIAEALFALLRASGRVAMFFVMRDLIAPAGLLAVLVLCQPADAFGLFSVFFAVWASIAAIVAMYIFGILRWALRSDQVRISTVKPIFRHTTFLMMANLGARTTNHIDTMALLFFAGLADVGGYRVAAQFAVGYIVVQHFVFLSMPFELRGAGHRVDRQRRRRRLCERQAVLISLAFAALILSALGAEWLLSILGERFTEVADVMRALFLIRFLELLWGPQHEVLVSNGLVRFEMFVNLIGIAIWVSVFFVAHIWIDPISSAVGATAIATHSTHAIRALILHRLAIFCPRLLPLAVYSQSRRRST